MPLILMKTICSFHFQRYRPYIKIDDVKEVKPNYLHHYNYYYIIIINLFSKVSNTNSFYPKVDFVILGTS